MSAPRLHSAAIRARRLELGLSRRRLAALLGPSMSPTTLTSLEDGKNHGELTLSEIGSLCEALGLNLVDLLVTQAPGTGDNQGDDHLEDAARESGTGTEGPRALTELLEEQVPRAGGVLVEVGRAIPVQTLAALLDLTLDETQVVIDELRTRAAGVGWDVFTVHRDVGARAAPPALDPANPGLRVDRALIETAWRRDLARRGLTITQAHLVHGALRGTKAKTLTNDDQVQTGSMVNAGVLARSASGGVKLSAATAFSLLL